VLGTESWWLCGSTVSRGVGCSTIPRGTSTRMRTCMTLWTRKWSRGSMLCLTTPPCFYMTW
jgi:hypothetical protein